MQDLGKIKVQIEKVQESTRNNKDLEELKNGWTVMMNNLITEMKKTVEGIKNRIAEAVEWISELEDRMVEITAAEQNKEKRMKRNENCLRDLCENI